MTEEFRPPLPGARKPWKAPIPLGYGPADAMALFIAAPLLTAAALSLAGVVGGAEDHFRWPGPILLLLVVAALTLIASIQLSYHSRLYLYSHADLVDWLSETYVENNKAWLYPQQVDDQATWKRYARKAVWCFNLGTLLLGLGIAAALVPPACATQTAWRLSAAVVTLVATVLDGVWIGSLYFQATPDSLVSRVGRTILRRRRVFNRGS
ncbi:hypothetical protein [Streptomyces griseorubiginosus]|uniref:hypothetical protein n=1 Tax=Streptomyces griseorubiginosus TaxID=67304 RepID=UPI001AD60C4E|nr:hypothetical protein [Streptomyces griseorubiginosus]